MAERKDKEKVHDEVWTETRIREFLDVQPAAHINADFHALIKAYQAMRAEDFEQFVEFFIELKRDINSKDPQGRTALSYIREHRTSTDYAAVLEKHGGL
jgi:FMN phosphatase YigB (HAD superfamily)